MTLDQSLESMTSNQFLERIKINFPESLKLDAVEDLFSYITKGLTSEESGCIIRYKVSVFKDVCSGFELYEEKVPKTKAMVVDGTMTRTEKESYVPPPLLGFECLNDENEDNLVSFTGIKFQTTPRYDQLKEEVKMIDDVREQVNKYFSQKQSTT